MHERIQSIVNVKIKVGKQLISELKEKQKGLNVFIGLSMCRASNVGERLDSNRM